MLLKKGETVKELPPTGQIISAAVLADGRWLMLSFIGEREMSERREDDLSDMHGVPTLALFCPGAFPTIHFWPVPDDDYQVAVRLYPPEMEI